MWVSIIPVGGLRTTGKVENISKQSKIATSHKGLIDLKLEDVEQDNQSKKLIMG
jgi:hypothetical protein